MWGELLEVMRDELALYLELQARLEADREKIVAFDTGGLLVSNQHKEGFVGRLQSLEQARVDRLAEISRTLGLVTPVPSLSQLDSHIPEELRPDFQQCAFELRVTVERVNRTNRENGRLVRHSMDYIHQSLAFLKRLIEQKGLYLPTGQLVNPQGAGKIVERRA